MVRHTYIEFAREKTSKEINGNFEKLRQLPLIKELKKCLPREVKTYLYEKKVETFSQVVVLADDYILTHKSTNQNPQSIILSLVSCTSYWLCHYQRFLGF